MQALFTRTTVTGLENVPDDGAYIAVGNHAAAIEVALMVVNLPDVLELVGNGDIPFDPTFKFMANAYRFIPVRRGYVDRKALERARQVLEMGHVLGAFPEGGIWDHNVRSARPGVAWLSQQTGVPILPVAFGGVLGALRQIWRLKRPRLTVTIGEPIPPVPCPETPRERKAAIQAASEEIMSRIKSLLPPEDRTRMEPAQLEEAYAFRVTVTAPDGTSVDLPPDVQIVHGEDLAYYFHRYILLEVIYRNYKKKEAKPLSRYATITDPVVLGSALDVALEFYEDQPVFLSYRLGAPRACRVMDGLQSLRAALQWAEDNGYQMRIIPERTVSTSDGSQQTYIDASVKREY
ncbi:MAG: 1-acyl-sn-glycerol-3-phosphate acyltransferase [Chloroflexi bacterium]|nr:1-acyl-sn-glycerol-3-phosphate acyltransferase [Chloroflexota bacterium]